LNYSIEKNLSITIILISSTIMSVMIFAISYFYVYKAQTRFKSFKLF